jgi:hypothetical protein
LSASEHGVTWLRRPTTRRKGIRCC